MIARQTSRLRTPIARTVVLVLIAFSAAGMLGQEPEAPLPVQVNFGFGNFPLPQSPSIGSTQATIATKIANALNDEFKFWHFTEQSIPDAPLLKCVLDLRGFDNVWLDVAFKKGNETVASWDTEVLPSGYTSSAGFPTLQQWPSKIEEVLKHTFIQARHQQLFEAFLAAPVGRTVVLLPGDAGIRPKAVLPLPWEGYKDFSTSQFVLRCRPKNSAPNDPGGVQILSEGRDASMPYSPDNPRYPGLVVELTRWKAGADDADAKDRRAQINDLEFLEFFLLRQKRPGEIQ